MRRRRGNTFRQKDRIRTTLCKVQRYAQGATCSGRESLRLEDGGTNHRKDRLCFFYTGKGGIAIEHFHLPTAFEVYSDERKAGFLKVKAAEKEGKRVAGCFRAFTTLAILDAAGQIDTRIAAFLETLGE